jgi:hypothetical protein
MLTYKITTLALQKETLPKIKINRVQFLFYCSKNTQWIWSSKITKQEYENCTFLIVQILHVVNAIILYMYINTESSSWMRSLLTVQLNCTIFYAIIYSWLKIIIGCKSMLGGKIFDILEHGCRHTSRQNLWYSCISPLCVWEQNN